MSDEWDAPSTQPDLKGKDVDNVLKDTTNVASAASAAPAENAFDPQAKGWAKPVAFDYDVYNRKALAVENGGTENNVSSDRAVPVELGAPKWASNAMRYEWKEEYGEIAPRIEELENELFRGEFRNRIGPKIAA